MLEALVNGQYSFSIPNGIEEHKLDAVNNADGVISILYKGKSYTALVETIDRMAKEVTLSLDGQRYIVAITEPIDALLASMGLDLKATKKAEAVKAPMPGMILKVLVTPGQVIEKGDRLIILEAMKMENVLKAAHPGIVKAIRAEERTAVEKGAVLIEME